MNNFNFLQCTFSELTCGYSGGTSEKSCLKCEPGKFCSGEGSTEGQYTCIRSIFSKLLSADLEKKFPLQYFTSL